MGKLLLFNRENRPDSEHAEPVKDAELVLFTGVRYQRQETEEETKPGVESKRERGA